MSGNAGVKSKHSLKHSAWAGGDEELGLNQHSTNVSQIYEDEAETAFTLSPAGQSNLQGRKQKCSVNDAEFLTHFQIISDVHAPMGESLENSSDNKDSEKSILAITVQETKDNPEHSNSMVSSDNLHSHGDSSRQGTSSATPLSEAPPGREAKSDHKEIKHLAQSHLKLRRKKLSNLSCLGDLVQKEESQLGTTLQKHEKRQKQTMQAVQEKLDSEEAYNFFTQIHDDESEEEIQQLEEQPLASAAHTEEEVGTDEEAEELVKLVTADYLGLRDEWDVVENVLPVYQREQQEARELELYFYPSSQPVKLETKLKPGYEPRYPEEEGLYVGDRPPVAFRNKNKLEQRLLACDDRKWFTDDGELITLLDPLKTVSYRPPVPDIEGPLLNVEYKPATVSDLERKYIVQPGEIGEDDNYLLEVDIISVTFTHHPLFSREHVLAQQVTDLFHKYSKRLSLGQEQRLAGRLEALRRARNNLKKALEESSEATPEQLDRLQRYSAEIRETRHLRQVEGRNDRKLLSSLLTTWRDLKRLREFQGYTSTSVRLQIHKENTADPEAECRAWDEEIQKEMEELEDEYQEEYNKQLEEYTRKLALWKKRLKTKRELKRSKQKNEKQASDASKELNKIEWEDVDEEPKPPAVVDMAQIRSQMMDKFNQCFRPPGEPKLHLDLTNSGSIDQNPSSINEQQRRAAVRRCSIYVKVFYNQKEVCKTQPQSLGPNFSVTVFQLFPIRILQWPENLKIEVHEEGGMFSTQLVAEIYIPIPSSLTTIKNCAIENHEFSNNQVITCSHAGVGSGTYFCPFPEGTNKDVTCLYTSGIMTYRVGWGTETLATGLEHILAPPEKYWQRSRRNSCATDIVNKFHLEGSMDIKKLKEWAEKSHLDPNDPKNASFFNFLKNAGVGLNTEVTYFRLDPLQSEFDFCTLQELEKNPRLRLLRLRDLGEPEFRGLRNIPIQEAEIPKDVFKDMCDEIALTSSAAAETAVKNKLRNCSGSQLAADDIYEKRLSSMEPQLESLSSSPLESHRESGQRFLQKVRQRILNQCYQAQQHRQLQDIVMEDQVPDIGTLGLTFMKWLQPKRPLRPKRKERKKVTVQNLGGQEVKVIVTVVHAFEVPVRKDVDTLLPRSQQGFRFTMVPVRPFVAVTFQGITLRTTTAEGASPTWNQDLQFPLRPSSDDFSPSSLQSIQDDLYIHLFDEVVVDLLEDERMRETNIHQRLERNWLGSLQIPFSTLYYNSRIEGTFKLHSPPVLLGYEREPHQHQFSGLSLPGESQNVLHSKDATFLTLFINVQPALNPPEPFKEKLESNELAYMEEHLLNWESQLANQFPHRKVKTLVIDVSGKSLCVTRFFHPLAPPVISEKEATTEEMAARFVSMIPMIGGSTLFPGLFDIWLTSDQVLQLLSGDSEDHAVLLCCYFKYLGKKAWLLLGAGIPHGPTAYVLTREEENRHMYSYWLWDPASGHKYNTQDSFCPLQKIYCIINEENIWANVQKEELPRHTRFDLTKRSDWWPAFGRSIAAPMESVQPASLQYSATSTTATQLLQESIENHLRDSLIKWRRAIETVWNRYAMAVLQKLLPSLEYETWNCKNLSNLDHLQELQHILASHKMCGFPINLPYTNMDAITEAVRATGVHYNESPDVEFALAVYVHSFPNNVLSVWIYVASLVRRR